MINKKIIIRISNELGNQMFMYASALGIANKLNINLIFQDSSQNLSQKCNRVGEQLLRINYVRLNIFQQLHCIHYILQHPFRFHL